MKINRALFRGPRVFPRAARISAGPRAFPRLNAIMHTLLTARISAVKTIMHIVSIESLVCLIGLIKLHEVSGRLISNPVYAKKLARFGCI